MRSSILFFAMAIAISCNKEDSSMGSSDGLWLRERVNNTNTGFIDITPPMSAPTELWKLRIEGTNNAFGSSAVLYKNLIITEKQENLAAIDINSGDLIWEVSRAGSKLKPTLFDGKLYVGSDGRDIYAVEALTGEVIWNIRANRPVNQNPIVTEKYVIIGDYGAIYALNRLNGELEWGHEAAIGQAAIGYFNETIYYGTTDGNLVARNINSGNLIWNFKTGNDPFGNPGIDSAPIIDSDAVYFGTLKGKIYKLNLNSGNLVWVYETDSRLAFGSGSVSNGHLFFGAYSTNPAAVPHRIICLTAMDGKYEWGVQLERPSSVSPIVVGNQVWIGDKNGLNSFSVESGEYIWTVRKPTGSITQKAPIVLKNRIFVVQESDLVAYGF